MKNWLLFLSTSLFWGGSFVAIKFVIQAMDPLIGAFWRVFVAVLILYPLLKVLRKPLALPKDLYWGVWSVGLLAAGIPFILLYWGEQNITAGLAGIINGTVPIWTLFFGVLFLRKRESFGQKQFSGICLGLLGIISIFTPALLGSEQNNKWLGILAVFGMAVSYGAGIVLNRFLLTGSRKIQIESIAFHQLLSSSVFLGVMALVFRSGEEFNIFAVSQTALWGTLYLAIFSTALGWIMFYSLIREWGAVRTSTITYVVPTIAIFSDVIVFSELPKIYEFVGMILIISGILLTQANAKMR